MSQQVIIHILGANFIALCDYNGENGVPMHEWPDHMSWVSKTHIHKATCPHCLEVYQTQKETSFPAQAIPS